MTQQGTTCLLEGAASSLPLETPYISQQAESINTFGTLQVNIKLKDYQNKIKFTEKLFEIKLFNFFDTLKF